TEGLPYSGPVAGFAGSAGASASDYSAVIAWGDGQSSAGSVSGNSTAGFTVSGTHTYANVGLVSGVVHLTYLPDSSTSDLAFPAAVLDAPLTATGTALAAFAGHEFTATVATFSDANPNGSAAEFSAAIAWGDGTTSAGTVTANATGGFDV